MKKFIIAAGVSALLMGTTVLADAPEEQTNNAAVIIKDGGCFVSTTVTGLASTLLTDVSQSVSTSSGNSKLVCKFVIPDDELPENVIKESGFSCGIVMPSGFVVTTDSKFVGTPGGPATLTCSVKGMTL